MKKSFFTYLTIFLMIGFLCSCANRRDTGMVAGGVLGGVAGHYITGGSTAGTIAGAVGGGFVGRELAR